MEDVWATTGSRGGRGRGGEETKRDEMGLSTGDACGEDYTVVHMV